MNVSDSGGAAAGKPKIASGAMEKGLFVREATGLVRRISIFDAFNINMGSIAVGGGWVSITFILAIFTNANLTISFLVGCAGRFAHAPIVCRGDIGVARPDGSPAWPG